METTEQTQAPRPSYYSLHREQMKAYSKAWRAAHPEKNKEYRENQKRKHPEKIREYQRKFYARNRERYAALTRAWREAHPEKVKEYARKTYENRLNGTTASRTRRNNDNRKPTDPSKVLAIFNKNPEATLHLKALLELRARKAAQAKVNS